MSSLSKNIFDLYASAFYQCVVAIGLMVAVGYMIGELYAGSFNGKNAIIDIWASVTCLTYMIGRKSKYKYMIMWMVLFSQIMLALCIVNKIG